MSPSADPRIPDSDHSASAVQHQRDQPEQYQHEQYRHRQQEVTWQPLHDRLSSPGHPLTASAAALLAVGEHLEGPLRDWLQDYLSSGGHGLRVALHLQTVVPPGVDVARYLSRALPASRLLTVLDAGLALHPIAARYEPRDCCTNR